MPIKGMTVRLITLTQTGVDGFNAPVYEESYEDVENVLVGQPVQSPIVDQQTLQGKMAAFSLGIPKGDTHIWKDQSVEFFGRRWHVFGDVIMGIEENVPGPWHHIYNVERYE